MANSLEDQPLWLNRCRHNRLHGHALKLGRGKPDRATRLVSQQARMRAALLRNVLRSCAGGKKRQHQDQGNDPHDSSPEGVPAVSGTSPLRGDSEIWLSFTIDVSGSRNQCALTEVIVLERLGFILGKTSIRLASEIARHCGTISAVKAPGRVISIRKPIDEVAKFSYSGG
jgi:hypothetical protein